MPEVDQELVSDIETIVDLLPRGKNEATGESYRGVFDTQVATAFYANLRDMKHPMAEHNEKCSYYKPCGNCRRCLLEVTSDAAIAAGKLVKVPRNRNKQDANGDIQSVQYVQYYRPGELKQNTDISQVLLALKARRQ